MFTSLLLCTHGTAGGRHAERLVFDELCVKNPDLQITVLTIIDQDWQDMTGDDWLNSSKTHTTFLDHVQRQMQEENEEDWQRIREKYPAAARATFAGVVGPIEETIAREAKKRKCDLIVIGPYRESRRLFNLKMEKGLRSRIDTAKLHSILPCPLLIAPPLDQTD
ncbi:MAG: universal stress protein [Thermodesulfobacteriota bacterium]|nr:universal stress protein [Thermodesulfobacteriota bacterium]